ncbi:MAG: tetratricopeptide repeat protein [Myxococcales bacterium]|nr:tetratricopeptide repeat protein [Myxococcota bacterium]MDW8281658.1 tetratricopeptide repeat protein [Myxococcales bacterium]
MSGALGAALLLSAVPLSAAGRYTKKEDTVIATQTALTKPTQRPERDKKKPDLTAADVFAGQGEALKAVTDSQIKVLQRLIDVTNDNDPEKPDLLFRMAELYAEQQRYYNFRARDLDEKIFQAQQKGNTALANQLKAQQADFERREKQWLLEAVKKYIEVANGPKYQSYQRMDQVLFYLAYLLTQVKKEEQARVFFKRLIKDYPQSPYLPHAYLSFGEYFFENRDLENALKFYEKVLQYPNSPVFGYALYKKGWVYYNLTNFKDALATFIEVVAYATNPRRQVGGKPQRGDAQLAKEAKKDIVRAYAQIGSPEKAYPFFQKHGGDYAMTMLEQLAELYNSMGKFADSIKVYRELIKLNPGTTKLCAWQTEILRNTLSMTGSRAVPETVKELQRLSAVYEKTLTMPGLKKDVVDECRDNTAGMLRELATVWHKEAQKTNDMSTYAHASDLYKEYLRRFPNEKDSYLMRWWYAELLFKLGSLDQNPASHWYCDAAPVYTEVVKADPKGPKLKDAAYAAVISWKNCLDVADEGQEEKAKVEEDRRQKRRQSAQAQQQPQKEEQIFAKRPIPEKQQKMLEAFDTYIKYVPDAPELVTIKYRRARVFYEYNHFEEAMPLFRDIAENHPKSELAIYSANLLLDCMAILKDYKNLESQVDKFLASPDLLRDKEFEAQLKKIKLATLRKRVEETEKAGDYRQCGVLYLQLADRYPDDPRIDEVYYNAGICFERARLIGLAIQAREKLISLKPDSQYAKRAIYRVGQNFQQIAAYENAAEKYETFASRFPGELGDPKEKDPVKRIDAPLALYTAAFFRRGLGQIEQSIKDVELFVKNYGGRKEFYDQAAGVFFEMGQIFEQRKDWNRLRQHFNEYLKNWATKGGIDRQIVAEVKLGEIAWRESCPVPGVNGACIDIKRERASSATAVAQRAAKGKKGRLKGPLKLGQCGPETKSKITVYERRPALVKEAMAHFNRALQLYKNGAAAAQVPKSDDPQVREARINVMTYHAALARMAQGDLEYEKLLQMKVPTGLVFDPKQKKKDEESKKRFKAWIESKSKQLQEAQKIYQSVILMKNAHWVIAAAARIGQLYQDFANGLYTAEVPQPPPPPPGIDREEYGQMFRDAYCDALTDQAEPLDAKAIEGLSTCLNKSTELNWFNEWSKLCELELNQIKPAEYPLASEIRAEPGYSSIEYDVAPVLTSDAGER